MRCWDMPLNIFYTSPSLSFSLLLSPFSLSLSLSLLSFSHSFSFTHKWVYFISLFLSLSLSLLHIRSLLIFCSLFLSLLQKLTNFIFLFLSHLTYSICLPRHLCVSLTSFLFQLCHLFFCISVFTLYWISSVKDPETK